MIGEPDPIVVCPNSECGQTQKWSECQRLTIVTLVSGLPDFVPKGCTWCGNTDWETPYEVIWYGLESYSARLFMGHYEPDTRYRIADAYRTEPMGKSRERGWQQKVTRVLDKLNLMAVGKYDNLRTLHRHFLEVLVTETTNEEFKAHYQKELDRRDASKKRKPKKKEDTEDGEPPKKKKSTKHWGPSVPEPARGWGKEHYD